MDLATAVRITKDIACERLTSYLYHGRPGDLPMIEAQIATCKMVIDYLREAEKENEGEIAPKSD